MCVFLEPIALYHTRDLHEPGDDGWLAPYAAAAALGAAHVPVGHARGYGGGERPDHRDVRQRGADEAAGGAPAQAEGTAVRVLDLRWLAPLPAEELLREADDDRPGAGGGRDPAVGGGVAEGVIAALADAGFTGPVARVTSRDSFIPLGDAAATVLLSEQAIETAARAVLAGSLPGR